MLLIIEHIGDNQYIQDMENIPFPVSDFNTGHTVVFRYAYKLDPLSLLDKTDKRDEFLEICEAGEVHDVYERIKEYYRILSDPYHKVGRQYKFRVSEVDACVESGESANADKQFKTEE